MGVFQIISLIWTLITTLPKLISIGGEIIKLLPRFKDGGLLNDLQVIGEIIKLIMGLASSGEKALATANLIELRNRMRVSDLSGIRKQRDGLRRRRGIMQGGAEPVEKV